MKGSRDCDNTYSISEEIIFFFLFVMSEWISQSFQTQFILLYDSKY